MKLNEIYGAGSDDEVPGEKFYGQQYSTLNDAQKHNKALSPGNKYQIWYSNKDQFRDFSMGLDWVKEKTPEKLPIRPEDLPRTHSLIGSISGDGLQSLEDLFILMQGDNWSPNGEANKLIKGSNTAHTSMSVGDIVVVEDGKLHMVDDWGFSYIHPINSFKD